jgi:hypothetical protein
LSANSSSIESRQLWEAEKIELIKARDEALAKAQAMSEDAKKTAEEAKNIRFSNARSFVLVRLQLHLFLCRKNSKREFKICKKGGWQTQSVQLFNSKPQ